MVGDDDYRAIPIESLQQSAKRPIDIAVVVADEVSQVVELGCRGRDAVDIRLMVAPESVPGDIGAAHVHHRQIERIVFFEQRLRVAT